VDVVADDDVAAVIGVDAAIVAGARVALDAVILAEGVDAGRVRAEADAVELGDVVENDAVLDDADAVGVVALGDAAGDDAAAAGVEAGERVLAGDAGGEDAVGAEEARAAVARAVQAVSTQPAALALTPWPELCSAVQWSAVTPWLNWKPVPLLRATQWARDEPSLARKPMPLLSRAWQPVTTLSVPTEKPPPWLAVATQAV
jgi:hypothetical protein